jgi:hypothetical protein
MSVKLEAIANQRVERLAPKGDLETHVLPTTLFQGKSYAETIALLGVDLSLLRELPYLDHLLQIREALSIIFPKYPLNGCGYSADIVEKLTGLTAISGHTPYDQAMHCCNYDSSRDLYIDLTLAQYEGVAAKIVLSAPRVGLFVEDKEMTHFLKTYGSPEYMESQRRKTWAARLSNIEMATIPAVLKPFFLAIGLEY